MNMAITARGWLVYDLTESASDLGWVTLSFSLPMVLLSLFGGVLADRAAKRKVIVRAQALNAAATAVLAYIIVSGSVQFWDFIWFGLFNGSVLALSMPARQAYVPQLVGEHRIFNAMALSTASWNLARILGPALAGILIAVLASGDTTSNYGVGVVYFMISFLYLVSSVTVLGIRHRGDPDTMQERDVVGDIVAGMRYVLDHRQILGLILLSIVPFLFGMPINTLLPAFNSDVLGGGAEDLGYLLAVMGAGAIIGSLMLARAGELADRVAWLVGTSALWGVFMAGFAFTSDLFWAAIFISVIGWLSAWNMSMNRGLIQLLSHGHMRGRIMSIDMMTHGLMPLGVLPIAYLAESKGVDIALAVAGLVLVVSSLALRIFQSVRGIDNARAPMENQTS